MISITTIYDKSKLDRLLVLHEGDHPFLRHDSVPFYALAGFFSIRELETALANGEAKPRENASPALVTKILNALIESDFTPNHVRAYCRTLADKPKI